MKHLALYRKWRPQRFADVVGQEHVARTLLNAIRQDRLSHAYLLCGPRGTGKTTSARLLAKALNCSQPVDGEPCNVCVNCLEITAGHSLDVIEIDAASNRGIDSARELREQVRYTASGGRYRVFIIDEFHMLTKEAFNALLKTLEEPPENVIFVLATTEPHEVLQTVVSRCQRFDFQRISVRAMREHLQKVATAENIVVSPAALEAMARKANGGLRDGMSLLDQVRSIGLPGEALPDAVVYQTLGLVQEDALLALLQAAFKGELETMLANLRTLLEQGHDAMQILAELIQLLRHLSLASLSAERLEQLGVPSHLLEAVKSLGTGLSRGLIVSAVEQLLRTSDRLHHCSQPDIWLEADLICLCLQGDRSLLQRLEALEQGGVTLQRAPSPARTPDRAEPAGLPPRSSALPVAAAKIASALPAEPLPSANQQARPASPDPIRVSAESPLPSPVPGSGDLMGLWRIFLEKVKETQRPLIGFLLNGKLALVSSERQTWVLEFNSKPHCERIRQSLKSGKLQQLVSEMMGVTYDIEVRLAGEGATSSVQAVGRPVPVQPAPVVAPPASVHLPASPIYSAPSAERGLQEPVATYQTRTQSPAFEDDIDMDFLPEDPVGSPARSQLESAHRSAQANAAEALQAAVAVQVAVAAPPREAAQNEFSAYNESAQPEPEAPAALLAGSINNERKLRDPVDLDYARNHPVEAVAELFKGKIIQTRS